MSLTRRYGRLALTLHILFSVGWLGAVVAYLALAIAGLTSENGNLVRGAYLSMAVLGWFVIVPFSLAALLAGFVESVVTRWGLIRHWWVAAKLVLTVVATTILLMHMTAVTQMAGLAEGASLTTGDFRSLRIQLVVHAAGGLLVLIVATVLSVYKPWGPTPYGRRLADEGNVAADLQRAVPLVSEIEPALLRPRWPLIVGVHAAALLILFLVMHLAGGGMRPH